MAKHQYPSPCKGEGSSSARKGEGSSSASKGEGFASPRERV